MGIEAAIRRSDPVVTAYRCHAWTFTRGVPVASILSELMGQLLVGLLCMLPAGILLCVLHSTSCLHPMCTPLYILFASHVYSTLHPVCIPCVLHSTSCLHPMCTPLYFLLASHVYYTLLPACIPCVLHSTSCWDPVSAVYYFLLVSLF